MQRSREAQRYADDYPTWLQAHRFFAPPPQKHILAVLSMPDTSKGPPNGRLSVEMSSFHVGVAGLPDDLGRPFIRLYCGWPELPIKTLAYKEGIGTRTYYDRAHKGAAEALKGMRHALNMVENMGLLLRADKTA